MQTTCKLITWALALAGCLSAADAPYFVTYSHRMEEPGNLELALNGTTASPEGGNPFVNGLLEIEYGVKAWWTTEVYLSGQSTGSQGALFTGYRWENRFRPLMHEHWINPVLYVEFVDINGADKSLKEIVGHDGMSDQAEPTSISRLERKRELETKLILSSNVRGWNISENIIAEKNLTNEPWEFGYAAGISRPLALAASPTPCRFCRENFRAGIELYGGLGTRYEFGLHDTSHYVAPTLAWQSPNGMTIAISPSFGLNSNSYRALLRFSVGFELNDFGRIRKK
jgi:hypothetical protein